MKRKLLLVLGLVALGGIAPSIAMGQAACKECYQVSHSGEMVIWECRPVEQGGYLSCEVAGVNCIMSGPCSPQIASNGAIEADGVLNRTAQRRDAAAMATASSLVAAIILPRQARELVRGCGGAVFDRRYSGAYAVALRKSTSKLQL